MMFDPDCLKTLFLPWFDLDSEFYFSWTVSSAGVLGLGYYFNRFLALKSCSEVLLSLVTKSIFGRFGDILSNFPTLTKPFFCPSFYYCGNFLEELELGFLLA